MKRSRLLIPALCLMIGGSVMTALWPEKPLDLTQDEEPFRSIAMPPLKVIGDTTMGGSVSLVIIDRNGISHGVTFPVADDRVFNGYPTAVHRDLHGKETILRDPARAKQIAVRLLRDHSDLTEASNSANRYFPNLKALENLKEGPEQWMRRTAWKAGNIFR